MELGTSFLKSKIARRFCTLFIVCAFIPTTALIVISYNKVVNQLEKQSILRLKRETKSYGLALFDRMIRIENDLRAVGANSILNGKNVTEGSQYYDASITNQLAAVVLYTGNSKATKIIGDIEVKIFENYLTPEILTNNRPYIFSVPASSDVSRISIPGSSDVSKIFFGVNIKHPDKKVFSIIGEVRQTYLWGIGPDPLLPPMTELAVYDSTGDLIMTSSYASPKNYQELMIKNKTKDLRVFEYDFLGSIYFASISNLFLESRFQKTGWIIVLAQARDDIMSSMDSFKKSFPFIILFFLLLILYLSVVFIRKGLEPLEKLKEGTRRIGKKDFSTTVDINSDDEFEDLGNSFNDMASKLDQQFNTLTVLSEIDRAILSSIDRIEILATTLQKMRTFFRCNVSMFAKYSPPANDHVKVYVMAGRRKEDPKAEYFILNEGEQESLFSDYGHRIIQDIHERPDFLTRAYEGQISQYLCLPLSVEGKIDRVLLLGWKDPVRLEEDTLNQARQIADQLAVALSNSKLLDDMKKLATGTIEALARTVDAKSKWTSGHSDRVSILSTRIAKAMGLSITEQETITRGGLLHDIGKIGIPLSIIDKPDKLTDEEYEEVRNHPAIGAKILEPIDAYQDILPLVKHHHEKFDGSGYPDGMKGDEIDIGARIMAVADVWDAVVSDRPYRAGWIHDKARKLIIDGAGTHFDPLVVETFLAVISED